MALYWFELDPGTQWWLLPVASASDYRGALANHARSEPQASFVLMTCTICSHPLREEIDRALIEGTSERGVVGRWGVSKGAVGRHGIHIARALTESEKAKATQALEHSDWLTRKLRAVAERSESRDDQFLKAAFVLSKHLGIHGKITGEIRPGDVNVLQIHADTPDPQIVKREAQALLEAMGATVLWPSEDGGPNGKEVKEAPAH